MQGGSDLRYTRMKYKASRVLYVLLVVLHCDSTVLYCSTSTVLVLYWTSTVQLYYQIGALYRYRDFLYD